MDSFYSLDNVKNQFASIAFFCRNSAVKNIQNAAVIELPVVVSSLIGRGRLLSTLLSCILSIAVLTNEV